MQLYKKRLVLAGTSSAWCTCWPKGSVALNTALLHASRISLNHPLCPNPVINFSKQGRTVWKNEKQKQPVKGWPQGWGLERLCS